MKKKIVMLASLGLFFLVGRAQNAQQLRGSVLDQVLQHPLAGATVTLKEIGRSVVTDEDGLFRFRDLPLGSYRIQVSYSGYKEVVLENVLLSSGKETVLIIPMETWIRTEEAILVKGASKKNRPLNDMSAVSARAFTVEETQRYAAAVNDPLRMATAFPGVLAADDGNNSIIIRGNAPSGLLWKMEGMDIPNPNHFSSISTSGGGISILSSQLLANSDFVTAAFAAEYGNALSGVFDLHLRKGNNEKREYTLQAGVLGLNAAIEGPFSKNYKGSYLVNYRYSTLELLNKVGILPGDASTNFQDLSYNIFLPAGRLGSFSLFGFSGLSSEVAKVDKDATKWENKHDRYPSDFVANTYMNGITHTILLGNRLNIKSGLGLSFTKNGYDEDYMQDDYTTVKNYKDAYKTRKLNLNSTLNFRFNKQLNLRAGVILQQIHFNYYRLSSEHEGEPLEEVINAKGETFTQQAFGQFQYKPSDRLALNAGIHYLRLSLNGSNSIEPRFSARWLVNNKTSISMGYGRHSQLQTMGVYFAQEKQPDGSYSKTNRNLGLTRADHYVFSVSQRINRNLLIKAEAYYQQLFNVPVSLKPGSTFSALNTQDEYVLDQLVNRGKGKNYGIEVSVERYLQNNFYLTLSNSIYESKYTAADGVERNTRFNANHLTTLIAGKDFVSARGHKTFGINIKTIYAGGLRTTPIDLQASRLAGYTVFKEEQAYSLQNPDYFRTDLRISMKWNRRRFTSTLSLDFQNLTNRLNVYGQWYDDTKDQLVTSYQTGLIPILNYKIEF